MPTGKTKPAPKPAKKPARRSKPSATPSKAAKPARREKSPARKRGAARLKAASKIQPLDLSAFPPESISVLERWICLACVSDVFTRHLDLAPRTAHIEIKRYTPSVSELYAPTMARPWFINQSIQNSCPYCGSASKWHASLMMAVAVKAVREPKPFLEMGAPVPLFEAHIAPSAGNTMHQYDVTADGRRFLVTTTAAASAPPLIVVVNWTAGLKK